MKLVLSYLFVFRIISASGQQSNLPLSLSYPESTFNADTCCWRKLSAAGHDQEAGQLILSYCRQNKNGVNHQALYWHAGQCFAFAGQNDLAKKYMRKTYSSFYAWFGDQDGRTWYYYARGTLAFIDRNKKTLTAMIEKWEDRYPQDVNYQSLTALLQHWEWPYREINKKEK